MVQACGTSLVIVGCVHRTPDCLFRKILAEYYDGRPVGIKLPNSLVLEVVDTAPVMKTATKTASSKPAKLENGVTINVPEFVGTGDKVKVNPSTGEYQERAKG